VKRSRDPPFRACGTRDTDLHFVSTAALRLDILALSTAGVTSTVIGQESSFKSLNFDHALKKERKILSVGLRPKGDFVHLQRTAVEA